MRSPELDFISRHPGGFDREFFEEHLSRIVDEYRDHRSLDPTTMVVEAILKSGDVLSFTGARAALTWIVLFTEDDAMRFVPYSEIVGIAVKRRPGPAPKQAPVGFSVERVEESRT